MPQWLRRLGTWLLVALAALVPAWGWLRERRARQAAERRWADEVERGRRLAELERERRRIEADRHAREAKVRTETESAAVAHETRAQEALEIADDLDALAERLNRTSP